MYLLCLMLFAAVACHKVIDSAEDLPDQNTTTLYPTNKTEESKTATSWKIETTFAESKIKGNATESKAQGKPGNGSQEFRPSPHIGSFVDEDSWDTFRNFEPVVKKRPTGFVSSKEEYRPSLNKIPKEYKPVLPYRVESAVLTRTRDDWRPSGETRPAEIPSKVPAGGLYKLPDAFKEKPGLTTDEDFGLEFNDLDIGKESALKKRQPNPWQRLAHLLTALIPVGLIVSALTPSIITIEPNGPGPHIPGHLLRRSTGSAGATGAGADAPPPAISESCRRRLLCELHSDHNYTHPPARAQRRVKQCHRIRCEDPAALARTLSWLLSYHPGNDHYT